jgi:hypothetical protein
MTDDSILAVMKRKRQLLDEAITAYEQAFGPPQPKRRGRPPGKRVVVVEAARAVVKPNGRAAGASG